MKNANPTLKGPKRKQTGKTIESILRTFIKKNIPQFSGEIVLNPMVYSLKEKIETYYKDVSHIKPGEAFMIGVDRNEKPGYRKSLLDTKLNTCIVSLFTDTDIDNKNKGIKAREIKKQKIKRVLLEAIKQNVVFSNQDLGFMMNLSPGTISKYIREIEEEENILLPRRGTIHDLGPTITHKVYILKKIKIELKSIEQTCRETYHSKEAVNRYLKDFESIQLLYEKNFSIAEIHQATKKSEKLIKEYIEIIDSFKEEKVNA
jgi:CTP-dependent riboflavin kinase